MGKDAYHHGFLKEELIKKGLELIKSEGVNAFTMRRVAELCDVSATAAYKHFKSKEELLSAIKHVIAEDFKASQRASMRNKEGSEKLMAIGRDYVAYLLENPEVSDLLFHGESGERILLENGRLIVNENSIFNVFYEAADEYLEAFSDDRSMRGYKILQMWCEVHGFAELISGGTVSTKNNIDDVVAGMLSATYITK